LTVHVHSGGLSPARVFEPMGIDEASYMDMTGFDGLYGPLDGVARDIRARVFTELWVTASVGIAGSKVTAKVASDYCKPNGFLEVPIGGDTFSLAPLPIEKLSGWEKRRPVPSKSGDSRPSGSLPVGLLLHGGDWWALGAIPCTCMLEERTGVP
jgi:hypothetical protein